MRTLVLALFLAAILAFFAPALRRRIRSLFARNPKIVWLFPFLLTAAFAASETLAAAFSWPLTGLMLLYALAPVAAVALPSGRGRPSARDAALERPQPGESPPGVFPPDQASCRWQRHESESVPDRGRKRLLHKALAVLLLWLPLEFAAGGSLVPRPAQGFLHSVAYGIAILLGLVLFAGYYPLAGMKYHLPRRPQDFWLPLAAFALLAPVLAILGVAIGFIPVPHLPTKSFGSMAAAMGVIFAGTALPEEILFRSLIQNLITQRFGKNAGSLFGASLIFGCAHLNNGPQALPNWRYLILATIAGLAYGRVFQKSSSVCSSAALHMLVDWTRHFFF